MPELKDMPRDGWEDADVDVSPIPTSAAFGCLSSFLSTVGRVHVF